MIRASENWVISDRFLHRFAFGYNRFGNANRSVYFNDGWPSKIGLTNQPDTTFPRFAFGGDGDSRQPGQLRIAQPQGESFEGSTIVQDDLTIIMGKHSIKTGFEGRFYYLENDSADGTATYNFNSAQTNLPGFDTQTGHAYGSFLLGAVQTSSRPVQVVNTRLLPEQLRLLRAGRLQGVAEADAQPRASAGRFCRACTRKTATSPTSI